MRKRIFPGSGIEIRQIRKLREKGGQITTLILRIDTTLNYL